MTVDKNLFLHDVALVGILKNEAPYLREWLDYHLLAGVDHFYLYDNDSTDNQAEVAKPYVEAGLVDYFHIPGKAMQMIAYNDAVKNFKFRCRYMTFIDADEFVFPKQGGGIAEIVDEIFSAVPNAGELSISWRIFGSNGHETADYSRGVLERFTRREADTSSHTTGCKFIADPRRIKHMESPHFAIFDEGFFSVTESKKIKTCAPWTLDPPQVDKIVINHYHCKSWEEYSHRAPRGDVAADNDGKKYSRKFFEERDVNEVFDDGILRYRAERAKNFRLPDKSRADERLLTALMMNLSPTLLPNTPKDFYRGKTETFLTCRAVASYLNKKLGDNTTTKIFEEAALKAIMKALATGATFSDAQIFIRELPTLLKLPYPVVKELRTAALQIIEQLKSVMHVNFRWKGYVELDYLADILKR